MHFANLLELAENLEHLCFMGSKGRTLELSVEETNQPSHPFKLKVMDTKTGEVIDRDSQRGDFVSIYHYKEN